MWANFLSFFGSLRIGGRRFIPLHRRILKGTRTVTHLSAWFGREITIKLSGRSFCLFFVALLATACGGETSSEPATPAATGVIDRVPAATATPEIALAAAPTLSPIATAPSVADSSPEAAGAGSPPATATPQAGRATALPGFRLPQGEEPGWLFHGTGDSLPPIAFSPSGELLATGHGDGSVILWSVASGGRVRALPTAPPGTGGGKVAALAFSPDGAWIAAARPASGRVDLWEVASGQWMRTLQTGAGLSDVAFSGDGQWLAGGIARGESVATLGEVVVWETDTWAVHQVLADVAPDLVFGRQEATLATVSGLPLAGMGTTIEPGAIVLWDAENGAQLAQIGVPGYVAAIDCRFTGENSLLAANVLQSIEAEPGYASQTLLFDGGRGALLRSLPAPAESGALPLLVEDVALGGNGKLVAVSYQPNQIVIWDAAAGTPLRELAGQAERLRYPVFSPDGTLLAASASDGRILLWSVGAPSAD